MGNWRGKVIGGGIGFMFGGPFGAILGAMAGDVFDKNYRVNGDQRAPSEICDNDRKFVFINSLAAVAMSVAKADGHIHEREVKAIENSLINLRFNGDDLNYARSVINKFAYGDINLRDACRGFKSVTSYNEVLMLLRISYIVAFADNVFHPDEEREISQIVSHLGIGFNDALKVRSEFVKKSSRNYEVFGLSDSASRDDIEHAFRNLSKKYHPDKVSHLGDEFSRVAKGKFQEINRAYQEIKMERGY